VLPLVEHKHYKYVCVSLFKGGILNMPQDIENLETRRPRIIIAKNQEKIMEIFEKFPTDEFAQHDLLEQTQIKYPASVHSALMALTKKGKIDRIENSDGSRKTIVYKLKSDGQ
jgi:Fe2+ or Zn2+ uptake regulation protein